MAQSFFRSGLGRLVVALMLLALAPALVVLAQLGSGARSLAVEYAARQQQQAAEAAVRLFEEMLDSVARTLENAAASAGDWAVGAECVARAAKVAATQPFIQRVVVVGGDGRVLCTSVGIPATPISLGDRPYLRRALASPGLVVGTPVVGRLTGEVVLPVAHAVPAGPPSEDGARLPNTPAVLVAPLDLGWFARLVHAMSDESGGESFALIVSDNAQVLAAHPRIADLPPADRPAAHPFIEAILAAPAGWAAVADFAGRDRIVGFAHTRSTGLAIAVATDRASIVGPITRELLIALGLIATAAAAGVGAALWVAQARIGRPLLALAEAAKALRDGEVPPPLADRPAVREIALLAQAFTGMAAEITRRQTALEAAKHELEAANRHLSELAERDPLTGLANRRAFDRALEASWKRAQRQALPLGLLIIDIDHFKQFNDRYGHLEGDACLIRVARQLASIALRPHDVVARLGGEEFAVLLPDTDLPGAVALGERIRARLHALMLLHEGSPHGIVTASIGAASIVPLDVSEPRVLLAAADRAVYAAKASGRDRVAAEGLAEAA